MIIKYTKKIGSALWVIMTTLIFFSYSSMVRAEDDIQDPPYHKIDSYIRYIPSRSVEAMPGEIEIIQSGAEYSYEFKAFDKLPVKLSLDTEYIGIENSLNDLDLPAHLMGLATDIETTFPFFKFNETYLRIGISPSFYADDWNFPSSSFRIPTRYFLIYRPNPQWTFLSGIAVYPDFENEVLPILGFIYKPNDKLTFNIIPKRPNITYALNDRVSVFAEGSSSWNKEFEVTRDNSKNVVLEFRQTYLGTGIKFRLNPHIQTSLSTGGMFNRSLRYRDGQGKVNIKNGVYTEFRIEIKV